jgi:hypothetical protein
MKPKEKILFLSMLALLSSSCSKTETGVVSGKHGTTLSVRSIKNADDTCVMDWFPVFFQANNLNGMFAPTRLNALHVYHAIQPGDTITFIDNKKDIIIIDNTNQIKNINGLKPYNFMEQRTR